jgi:hypothetical protein
MVRVLELVDETGDRSEPTGDTVTLDQSGKLSYKGTRVQAIFGKFLADHSPQEVFDKMAGWSNGYTTLREKVT